MPGILQDRDWERRSMSSTTFIRVVWLIPQRSQRYNRILLGFQIVQKIDFCKACVLSRCLALILLR
jgi:hypothetical protein